MKRVEKIKNYYKGELKRDPEKFEYMGWESKNAQFQRFSVLTDYVDLNGKRVLDVGCGLGHLLDHLDNEDIETGYTGLDLLPSIAEEARKRHSSQTFLSGDIFLNDLFEPRSFDIIYCSGLFNLNMGNNYGFLIKGVSCFLKLVREKIVFNLLHEKSPHRDNKFYYFNPEQVVEELEKLPESFFYSIQLIEHYLNNDFTIILNLQDGPHCNKEN